MAVTNIQLMEWLAKGNGIAKNEGTFAIVWFPCVTD